MGLGIIAIRVDIFILSAECKTSGTSDTQVELEI